MQELGATTRLHELLDVGDAVIEGFAKGVLQNMREVVIAAATVRHPAGRVDVRGAFHRPPLMPSAHPTDDRCISWTS